MPSIAVFADVQNLYYTTRDAYGRPFDYRKLWRRIDGQGNIVAATAYAIERDDDGQRRFQDALAHIGFTVRLKPWIRRQDGSAKGDWDVGITIDVMEAAPGVDTVILLTGDGDFAPLVEKIRIDRGIRVEVYGVPGLTAKSLKDAATVYHPIEDDLLL